MSALGGKRLVRCGAMLLAVLLGTAGLSACEYATADDPRAERPAGVSSPDPVDPYEDNLEALAKLLGPRSSHGLPYGTGTSAGWTADVSTGEYLLTAACVGSPGAEVAVTNGDAAPEKSSIPCGMGKVIHIDVKTGKVLAEVVPDVVGPGTVTGIRLDPHPAPRNAAAQKDAWMTANLSPEKPGEFRRYAPSREFISTGPVAAPGRHELTLVCIGPDAVVLAVVDPAGAGILNAVTVPCGTAFHTTVQLGPEGAMVMTDSNNDPMQAAFSILPVAGGGS